MTCPICEGPLRTEFQSALKAHGREYAQVTYCADKSCPYVPNIVWLKPQPAPPRPTTWEAFEKGLFRYAARVIVVASVTFMVLILGYMIWQISKLIFA